MHSTVYRGPCLTKLREILSETSQALCTAVAHDDGPGPMNVAIGQALGHVERACDELGGLPPPGVGTGEGGWGLTEEDLKGFPCPCSRCAAKPSPKPAPSAEPDADAVAALEAELAKKPSRGCWEVHDPMCGLLNRTGPCDCVPAILRAGDRVVDCGRGTLGIEPAASVVCPDCGHCFACGRPYAQGWAHVGGPYTAQSLNMHNCISPPSRESEASS